MSARILIEECVGETRAAAIGADGRAFALYLDRWVERGRRVRCGDIYAGRLTRLAPKQGGGFASIETGEEVFLRGKTLGGLTEGAALNVQIEVEARRGKLARASAVNVAPAILDPFQNWRTLLPNGQSVALQTVSPGNTEIDAAFDEALSPSVTMQGGGVLRISQTPALTAIDIDTAGRDDAGRAYDRALTVNKVAAAEAARQLALRGLGGAVVIDCVAPLRKDVGGVIKQAFLVSFRAICARKAEALAPSPFGLMEIVLAWRAQPVSHAMLDEAGLPTPLTELLSGVRALEREATVKRVSSFVLHVPECVAEGLSEQVAVYSTELADRYGARLSIRVSDCRKPEVEKI